MPDLIDVAEARQQLNITTEVHDTELMTYVSATTEVIERHIGPVLPRDVVEVHPSGSVLVLYQPPVLSLTSLEAVLTGGPSYAVADLDVDPATGIVRRLDGGGFTGPLRVTYRAGRDEVPPNVGLAARIIVQHLWRTQRGTAGVRVGGMEEAPMVAGYDVPPAALRLLGTPAPVIA
jgi:hypothetical protein